MLHLLEVSALTRPPLHLYSISATLRSHPLDFKIAYLTIYNDRLFVIENVT